MRFAVAIVSGVVLGVSLAGCAGGGVYSGGGATIDAGDADRERVIGVVRGVLSDYRFSIDRVDAARGVVTTAYKRTHGLATPWDAEQSSISEEFADFANQHERSVRVELGEDGGVHVAVLVRRIGRPGWRVETESIRYSSQSVVVVDEGRSLRRRETEQIGQDGALAARIAFDIERGLGGS